jgi:RimJ/RimL family protein N-acetyltransferase
MPRIPEPTESLRDERVALRLSAERDIPEILIAYQDDPQLHVHMGEQRPPSGAELGRREERAAAERAAGTHVTLTILEPGLDICRGQIYVHHVDWDNQRAELGMWLAPQVRGRGLASRSLRLAGSWLLRTCGFERVQVVAEPGNEPMIRAARAAGFQDEGVLRGYLRERGTRIDVAIMSLLPSDLDDRRACHG